eukprot:EG_transcript_8687
MLCCCCCGFDGEDAAEESGEETAPLVRTPTRFRPKRLPPPQISAGSPLPFLAAHELVYFLSSYRMVGAPERDRPDPDTFFTIGAQKVLAGCCGEGIMVKDYMTDIQDVLKCSPDTRVIDAVNLMVQQNVSIILVMDRKHPVGLLTMKGVLRKVVVPQRSPLAPVSDVMSRELHTVAPDATHAEAVDLLHFRKTHCLVVVGAKGQCLGVATSYDIARMDAELLQLTVQCSSTYTSEPVAEPWPVDLHDVYTASYSNVNTDYMKLLHQGSMTDLCEMELAHSRMAASKVSNFMKDKAYTVTCSMATPVAEVATILATRATDAVVVLCNNEREPAGLIVLQTLVPDCVRDMAVLDASAQTVMRPPVTIQALASRNQAASLMHRKQVHHLVVVGRAGELLGLLTSLDIARLDAGTLKRNLLRRGSMSGQSIGEDGADQCTVQVGTRVSLTLEATFLNDALAKD